MPGGKKRTLSHYLATRTPDRIVSRHAPGHNGSYIHLMAPGRGRTRAMLETSYTRPVPTHRRSPLSPLRIQRQSLDGIAHEAERRGRQLRVFRAAVLMLLMIAVGTAGFSLLTRGAHSLIDCFYMTVITISTVGFGEAIPIQGYPDRQLYTAVLVIFGGGSLVYFLSAFTAMVVEGDVFFTLWRRRMGKRLEQLTDHVIVAGVGRNGGYVVEELVDAGTPTLAIDNNPAHIDDVLTKHPQCLVIVGDAIDEATLAAAGLDRARALVAVLPDDRDNLLLVLTARQLCKEVHIVAKCEDERNLEKLERVGASRVVSPTKMGGHRMASEVLRPHLVRLTESMYRGEGQHIIQSVRLVQGSEFEGQTVRAFVLEDTSGCNLLGLREPEDDIVRYHPGLDKVLVAGSEVTAVGTPQQLASLRQALGHRE